MNNAAMSNILLGTLGEKRPDSERWTVDGDDGGQYCCDFMENILPEYRVPGRRCLFHPVRELILQIAVEDLKPKT